MRAISPRPQWDAPFVLIDLQGTKDSQSGSAARKTGSDKSVRGWKQQSKAGNGTGNQSVATQTRRPLELQWQRLGRNVTSR